MIEVTQDKVHVEGPLGESNGNCLSAVIASLLHLDIKDVPVFKAKNFKEQVEKLNEWLRQYGLAYIYNSRDRQFVKGCYHEMHGTTDRFGGKIHHSTVAIDGHIVWDPHPSRSGLASVRDILYA